MLRVGLTGGIGSGKSTVCALFEELGVPVVDTDKISHQLTAPGSPLLPLLEQRFPGTVTNGVLDRAALRQRVFDDDRARRDLEALLHPRIREQLEVQLSAIEADYVVIAIPLLVEKGWQENVDRVVVVDVPPELQRSRAAARDGVTPEQVDAVLAAQASRSTRLAAADHVIDNAGAIPELRRQVMSLHRALRADARQGHPGVEN